MMKRIKYKHILIIVLVLSVVMISGVYIRIYLHSGHLEQEEELGMIREEISDKITYSIHMLFDNNFLRRDYLLNNGHIHGEFLVGRLEINKVVFVYSEEDAEGFSEDVLVAWPTEGSEMFLELINEWLDPEIRGMLQHVDMEIYTDDLNLELPLLREFMVDEWETMIEIRERLGSDGSRSNDSILRNIAERESASVEEESRGD